VTYLEDLIGTLQCPGCGENILHGREEPHWHEEALEPHRRKIDVPEGHHVELEEDTDEAELRATAVAEEEPLPGVSRENRPGGIAVAAGTWMFVGVLAILVNVPLFIILAIRTLGSRNPEGLSPAGVILFGVVLIALAAVFYVALIRTGNRFRKGAYRHVQLPAWLVLLVADGLVLAHAGLALPLLPAVLSGSAPAGMTVVVVVSLMLVALDLLLIAASGVLLWQSGRYAHWARGAVHRPVASADRSGFPKAVSFAGQGWLLVGLVALGLTAFLASQALPLDPTSREAVPVYLRFGVIALVTLTPFLLGFALLFGRLSSTIVPGWTFLVAALALLGWLLISWSQLPDPGTLDATRKDALDWERFRLLMGMALCGLGVIASVACLIGDGAYRTWLRAARGLHV
jgi:hypothetical protein